MATQITQDDINSLGEKLNNVDLTNEERSALELAFALAGQAVEAASEDDDVSGFKFSKGASRPFKPASFPTRLGAITIEIDVNSDIDYTVDADFTDWI